MSTLEEIESIIKSQKPTLRARWNVKGSLDHLSGVSRETSDLDILVEFDEPIGLIKFVGLQNYLSDLLEKKVDLVSKKGLKPRIGEHIQKEVVYV